jgi:hypothetical protein
MSKRRLEKLCHTDNVLCEVYRKKNTVGLFFYGQSLYDIVEDDESDGTFVIEKKFGDTKWVKT